MLLKRNLLESLLIWSCSGTFYGLLIYYTTNISPLRGIWFIFYFLILSTVVAFICFTFLHRLLHSYKPIQYDIQKLVKYFPFLSDILPQNKRERIKEYDTNELSIITTVLEKKLVSSWYVSYISEEIGFPFACKQMLDQMIAKGFQICDKIESKDTYVDVCAILISHLKEYKKALKRSESQPGNSIETLYYKIHPTFKQPDHRFNNIAHYINLLRIILKELVPWRLWDTPYSELLIRILAKKLDTFIDDTISDPVWLNDRLLTILNAKQTNPVENVDLVENGTSKKRDKVEIEQPPKNINKTVITRSGSIIEKNVEVLKDEVKVKKIVEEKKDERNEETHQGSEPVEVKPAAILRQRRGRQGRNEVKIYDRIIEGGIKTWDTDLDLQCISVGQDLLASLDEMTLSRLWGHEEAEHSPNLRGSSPQPLWFGEEDAVEIDAEPAKETRKDNSPKPGDALLKDIQSTVHHAKTKIGDLQVPLDIDVTLRPSDEAAGMMEGLLDKGIAGIRKGLRFTGLSDDVQEKPQSSKERGSEKISPSELYRSRQKPEIVMEAKESYAPTTLHKEENGNSVPQLIKQHRVTSQDSMAKPRVEWSPPTEVLSDSPEPQYEEAADLSASIAKLRSLLQHAERPRGEEVWWEGAEETRGRAQRRPSSRPVDSATFADEYDMSSERNASPGQTTNNMQRLDKLFQRTVTGVFNSIRTAVGVEGAEGDVEAPRQLHDWAYVCTSPELNLGAAVSRLVDAHRSLWQVDAAIDSLQQLRAPHAQPVVPVDLEEWCSGLGSRWCATSEVACAAGLATSHIAFLLAAVLIGDLAESLICIWLEEFTYWLRKQVFVYFQQLSDPEVVTAERKLRKFDIDETCKIILENIPETYVFGERTLSQAIKLVVSSFSHKDINKDFINRTMDVLTVHFKQAAGLRNPSFDNN